MKTYSYNERPIKVFGVVDFEKKGKIQRLPDELIEKIPRLSKLGRRCTGARLCFKTDSQSIKIRITFETLSMDVGMSIYSCQSAAVYAGDRPNSRFLGLINPTDYNQKCFEKTVTKEKILEDVIVWLPRNEVISDIEIEIDDDAVILEPTPYKYSKPILYYGSSITQGGCVSRPGLAYPAIISNELGCDYINLGFSGSAKGETVMAEYIASLNPGVFVLDYDHNAQTEQHLEITHEKFFKTFRMIRPDTPVVIISAPNAKFTYLNWSARRKIIKTTYDNALISGDKNVYFIDGETLWGEDHWDLCTMDRTHPNDLGHFKMAQAILPTIKEIVSSQA
jgi:hypothetical protein